LEKLGQSLDSDDWKDPHSLMAFYWEERELEPYGTAIGDYRRIGDEGDVKKKTQSFWAVTFWTQKNPCVCALCFGGSRYVFFRYILKFPSITSTYFAWVSSDPVSSCGTWEGWDPFQNKPSIPARSMGAGSLNGPKSSRGLMTNHWFS